MCFLTVVHWEPMANSPWPNSGQALLSPLVRMDLKAALLLTAQGGCWPPDSACLRKTKAAGRIYPSAPAKLREGPAAGCEGAQQRGASRGPAPFPPAWDSSLPWPHWALHTPSLALLPCTHWGWGPPLQASIAIVFYLLNLSFHFTSCPALLVTPTAFYKHHHWWHGAGSVGDKCSLRWE